MGLLVRGMGDGSAWRVSSLANGVELGVMTNGSLHFPGVGFAWENVRRHAVLKVGMKNLFKECVFCV